MGKKVKIPIPPRPNFPSASYIAVIEEASERLEEFLSSILEPHTGLHPSTFELALSKDQTRAYFEAVDKQIRASFLKVAILVDCTEQAKEDHLELCELRDKQWSQFQKNEPPSGRWTQLPLEIVSQICALDSELRPCGLKQGIERWGDLYCKVNKVHIHSSEVTDPLTSSSITKSSKLVLNADGIGSVSTACDITHKWTGVRAPRFMDQRENDQAGPPLLFATLQEAKPILPHLEGLCIPFGRDFQDHRFTTGPDGAHWCSACKESDTEANIFTMPSCKVAEVPLMYLPYIGASLKHLVHLSIDLPHVSGAADNFGSYFHHVSLEHLQTLRIVGPNDNYTSTLDADYVARGPILDAPSLTCLTIVVLHLDSVSVTALIKRLNCPKLRCAILSDLFVMPFNAGVDPTFNERTIANQFCAMIDALDKCKDLRRLSFYVDQSYVDNISPWCEPKPLVMVHHFLDALYFALTEKQDGYVRLPALKHLTIPVDGHLFAYESLIAFIGARNYFELRLRTLEIAPRPVFCMSDFQLHNLELYVDEVITPYVDLNSFFIDNVYFPGLSSKRIRLDL